MWPFYYHEHVWKVIGVGAYAGTDGAMLATTARGLSMKYSKCTMCGEYQSKVIPIPVDLLASELQVPISRER